MSFRKDSKPNTEQIDETQRRRAKILELISDSNNKINSQEQLVIKLKANGFPTTSQPTLSRDFNALGIVKDIESGYYTLNEQAQIEQTKQKFKQVVQENITELIEEAYIFAFKTTRGNARSTSVIIEETFDKDIVGTISGDDTALVIVKDENTANRIISEIKNAIEK